jgi:hypothetical protein
VARQCERARSRSQVSRTEPTPSGSVVDEAARHRGEPTLRVRARRDAFGRDLTIWTYRLEPAGMGTQLTESFELFKDIP